MAITIDQQMAAVDAKVDVSNTPYDIAYPAATATGSALVLLVSGWNFDEPGYILSTVTGGGNTWTRQRSETNGARGRAEIWTAVNAAATTTVTLTPGTANGSNRITSYLVAFAGVDAAPLDIVTGNSSGLNTTALTVTSAATAQDNEVVVCLLSTLWPDTPKTHAVTAGYTTLASLTDTSGNQCGFLASYKLVSAIGTQSAAFTFNNQTQGAQAALITLKEGSVAGYEVLVEGRDAQAIGATTCTLQVMEAPTGDDIVGPKLFTVTGYTMIDDGAGLAGALLTVPGGVTVTNGQSVRVIARGQTGGQLWGNHPWPAVVQVAA